MVQLIIALLVLVLVVFPMWAWWRIAGITAELERLRQQIADLREERMVRVATETPTPPAPARSAPEAAAPTATFMAEPAPIAVSIPAPIAPFSTTTAESVAPERPLAAALGADAGTPPALPPREPISEVARPRYLPPKRPRVDWEQFMGAKLFAWLGGVAALLGVGFFVKYSFEHDLIPPEVRVAIGYLFALGLIVGGLKLARGRYSNQSQTLVGTGVVSLYAVTFACNSIYHFASFGPLATFALMSLITAAAFVLSVRLEAQVVAVLGMLGGFITPVLLSTGHDNAPALFTYIALLDVGLVAIALQRNWHYLVALGAGGTIAMQVGWAVKFLNASKAPTAMVVCLGFCALFLLAYATARRLRTVSAPLLWSAVLLPWVAFGFAAVFLGYSTIAVRPGLLFSFVLAADICLLAITWVDEDLPQLHLVAGMAVFALLAAWTGSRLTAELLPWALVFYLLHAILHTAFPLVLARHRTETSPNALSQFFPAFTLLLMLGPLFKLDGISLAFWPCVLLVDLLAIGLALFTASLMGVAIVLVLTLAVTAAWVFRAPVSGDMTGAFLLVVGGFAVLFFAAGLFLSRRFGGRLKENADRSAAWFGDARAQLPAFSALLPFLLLVMMTQRLPLANPSPVFGLALLLLVLTVGLACMLTIEWLPACALAGVAALEYAWRARHATVDNAPLALAWYLGFYVVFTFFPFVFRRRLAALTGPWAVSALAGILQFPLVYQVVQRTHPNDFMGLLPALFAVPPLASLFATLRATAADQRARLNQLAWFGGVALFFITLIFPIQFERQWITLGWALEGVALLWLFHRVPHPALRGTGFVLLVIAFVRLALNPAVLEYHARSQGPIFNWYLYSYGIVTGCLFLGVRLLGGESGTTDEKKTASLFGLNPRAMLGTLGTVLAFLLLNIEIADFFSTPGTRVLTFQFSGSFARDMSYTIGWALFALALLLISFWKHLPAGRWAALTLLGVTLLKLFFHDLARLEALYRIGALFGVAIIAIVASFAYQRFLPANEKTGAGNP